MLVAGGAVKEVPVRIKYLAGIPRTHAPHGSKDLTREKRCEASRIFESPSIESVTAGTNLKVGVCFRFWLARGSFGYKLSFSCVRLDRMGWFTKKKDEKPVNSK
jgi:hypothetical protein